MESILSIKGVTKKYKKFTLGSIDTEIPKGFSTALIGANGAGKTTLMDIAAGISLNYKGDMTYFGSFSGADHPEVRNAIGYVSAANYFGLDWKPKNIGKVLNAAFDNFSAEKYDMWVKRLNINTDGKKIMNMSDGNIMRLMLASVLARDTKLLVLDEPASPLDPLMRDRLCDIFREYTADGEKSVFFSTHNIADMENVTDYAIIMSEGKIIEQGFTEELREKYILVHGDSGAERIEPYTVSVSGGKNGFEAIAEAKYRDKFETGDMIIETPALNAICVALLKKAEKEAQS